MQVKGYPIFTCTAENQYLISYIQGKQNYIKKGYFLSKLQVNFNEVMEF